MSRARGCSPRPFYVCAALASLLAWWLPAPASACGGFFCSAATPVNQAAERIVFVQHDDVTVTAVVQIQYSGPAERFSWVLPVLGNPSVGLSSDIAFTRLQAFSDPRYVLNTRVEGECAVPQWANADAASSDLGAVASFDGSVGSPVTVIAHSQIGPYVYDVIQLDPTLESPGAVAVEWFAANGYDVSGLGASTLGSYLLRGMNLIAFKLEKGNSVGTLRPIRIRFDMGCPMIPIRPTAVAATPDMGVLVWVVGPSRAVPINYLSLELNEAALDWMRGASNYNDVVTRAANEAGGHGFVTEHAQPASVYRGVVFSEQDEGYINIDWEGLPLEELLRALMFRYATWNGTAELLTSVFETEVSAQDLSLCLSDFVCTLDSLGPLAPISADRAALRANFEADVIEPVRATEALVAGGAYVTRLYTTLSADEMTVDPAFDFNPELPVTSNLHVAERVVHCSPNVTFGQAPWTATLPNGQVVYGAGAAWPVSPSATMPALKSAIQHSTSGPGQLVIDNDERITLPSRQAVYGSEPGGCSAGQPGPSRAWLGALALAALVRTVRRRS